MSTKIHVAVDAQGQPVEMQLGPGQEHDVLRAETLLASYEPKYVIADKGYYADDLIKVIAEQGAQAVIPRGQREGSRRDFDAVAGRSCSRYLSNRKARWHVLSKG
ncbi:MAG: transposase [Pirellulales bacterium]|nr:transposase [Pirellulales bacterium]